MALDQYTWVEENLTFWGCMQWYWYGVGLARLPYLAGCACGRVGVRASDVHGMGCGVGSGCSHVERLR
jgi:hypothetical protein